MSNLRWSYIVLVLVLLSGCREDPASPIYFVEIDHSVDFEIQLAPQGSTQEQMVFESSVDLGVRVADLSSIVFSTKGTAYAAIHACGVCEPSTSSPGSLIRQYSVPKYLFISLESDSNVFTYQWSQEDDGSFVLVDEPLTCDFVCNTFFADGLGTIKVSYGDRDMVDAFMCFASDGDNLNPDFCVLDAGSLVFDESIVFTFNYQKVTPVGVDDWNPAKTVYR